MKANDSIPRDEMLLAEAIAAAKGRGLGLLTGGLFAMGDNVHNDENKRMDRCCAYGALVLAGLAPRWYGEAPNHLEYVGLGNDYDGNWHYDADGGETLGYAFRCFFDGGE